MLYRVFARLDHANSDFVGKCSNQADIKKVIAEYLSKSKHNQDLLMSVYYNGELFLSFCTQRDK